MQRPTILSAESPLVLYSAHDSSLAVHRMHREDSKRHRMNAEAFEQERRRKLGLSVKPRKKGIVRQVMELVKF